MTGRTEASARNLSVRWLNQLSVILFRFLNRAVFVRLLPPEYLGLSGLFTQMLTVLSLAELGVGSAISYYLYRPLSEQNWEKVAQLMALYRKIYNILGIFILTVGSLLIPLLPYLAEDSSSIPHLNSFYLLFVVNASLSYFWAYKGALFAADQKNYVPVLCNMCTNILSTSIQIGLLAVTGNYGLYLAAMVLGTLANNLLLSFLANRAYPFLKSLSSQHLPRQEIRNIFHYTSATLAQKLGQVAVDSTDHLVISRFCGLVPLGCYTNYALLVTTLRKVIQGVFQSVGASLGNLGASESIERQMKVFDRLWLLSFWGFSYAAAGVLCVSTTLVAVCFGQRYTMEPAIPLLLAVSMFLTGQREVPAAFLSSMGLLDRKRFIPLLEAGVNLAVSILLAGPLGIQGVLLGTIIGALIPLFLQPWVLYREWFHQSFRSYMLRILLGCVLASGTGLLSWLLCRQINGMGILALLGKILICTVVVNGINTAIFCRTDAFAYYVRLLKNFSHKGTSARL